MPVRNICACASVLALTLVSSTAGAQSVADHVANRLPPGPALTEAQKLIAALSPPAQGGVIPPGEVAPDAPMPGADPRDLRGVWYHIQPLELRIQKDVYGFMPPYTMAGAKVLRRRTLSREAGRPYLNASALCLPPGPLWQQDLNMPFSVFQSSKGLELLFEEYHGRLPIVFDAKDAPASAEATYMGTSIGHWEGDTLVVETSGFKQGMWLDSYGTPLSKNGKIIQRIRKIDFGDRKPFLQIETTFSDPLYYTQPWSVMRKFSWQPNRAYFEEYNCEEQIGDPSVNADSGLISEPTD